MDALDRMYDVLVRTIRANHPTFVSSPFTVGDLHQQILPYRHFRRELGLETNQEYEMVLMELLTGARGYLDVDEQLRDELGKELESRAPEPSRVREFADAHVSLKATGVAEAAANTPAGGSARATPVAPTASGSAVARTSTPTGVPIRDPRRCHYCSGELPVGRELHFCPHCGQNLRVLNCTACGAEVEAGWKFCVACGKAAVA